MMYKNQLGFTLIEIIIGIVALSFSLIIITGLIVPAEQKSADQIHQIKAAELGQSLLDEILAHSYDENSDRAGSHWRCDETGKPSCTVLADFGPDSGETSRSQFDDVDDYHGYSSLITSTDTALDSGYNDFSISVSVSYDGLTLGLSNINLAKKIEVTITTPLNTDIKFTAYKTNF